MLFLRKHGFQAVRDSYKRVCSNEHLMAVDDISIVICCNLLYFTS